MSSEDILNSVRGQLELLLKGSRYKTEKLLVIGGYLVIMVVTILWSFGGTNQENELGARYGVETIAPLNDKLYFIENTSGSAWSGVRIVLNGKFLYKLDEVPDGERLVLQPEDFNYFFYIPRPWGRSQWELLETDKKPGKMAQPHVEPEFLELRAREGRLKIDVANLAKN